MKKPFHHCKIQDNKRLQRTPFFGKFGADFQRQPFTNVFSRQVSLKLTQYWSLFLIKLQVFFYRTPTVAASGFSQQQISFSAKSGMYWGQSHRFLSWTPLKTRVKPQKQQLQLHYKKWCSQKFCKFHRKTPVLKSLFNRVACQETQAQIVSCGVYETFKNSTTTASETVASPRVVRIVTQIGTWFLHYDLRFRLPIFPNY